VKNTTELSALKKEGNKGLVGKEVLEKGDPGEHDRKLQGEGGIAF